MLIRKRKVRLEIEHTRVSLQSGAEPIVPGEAPVGAVPKLDGHFLSGLLARVSGEEKIPEPPDQEAP